MKTVFAFDVDGTLTQPRQAMSEDFAIFFRQFVSDNPVYLITGSDRPKIQQQVPEDIMNMCLGTFTCSGAEYWEGDSLIYRRDHSFPKGLHQTAQSFIDQSPYPHRYGTHIEPRPGMLNISVVGRQASLEQRSAYNRWDREHGERLKFVEMMHEKFPDYEATTGGEISIDIVPMGWNKSVAKAEIQEREGECHIMFFGDRLQQGGNDKPLADALESDGSGTAIEVSSYEETWQHLRSHLAESAA